MKKIGIVLLIILIFPVFVSAGSFSSDTSKANNYLQRDTFSNSYKKYLLYNNLKFGFNNGKPETNTSFTMGGFISEGEYKLTIPNKGSSYLLTGDSYWTLTPDGSKYKVIEYNGSNTNELNSYESGNTRPKARVTEYVAPNTSVSGTGRQTDPWIFDPMFRVDFEILGGHATINGSSEDDGKKLSNIYLRAKCKGTECTKTITLTIEDGYNFISDTCDGSYNYERNEYTVNNLTKDVECKLTIGIGKFHVNLVKGDWEETRVPSPDNVYLRQRENYYRENTYTNIIYKLDTNPERYGYTFKGYNIKDTNIKIIDNTGKFIDKTSIKVNNQEIISDWQKNIYTLTFNPNGGTINASEKTKQVTFDEAYGILPLATRAGYSFKGWYTSASNNEQITSTQIVKYAGNRTLYAQWTICSVGTYNTGNKTTCTACPTGYTSAQGSTAENQCYMNVPGGKYLTAKNSSAVNCPVGQYRSGTVKRYYGESVSCVNCTAGTYQNSTGQTSCKTCPNGYTSSVKATAENQCFLTVPSGNKLVAKSTPSACDAGTVRDGAVVKNYGQSVSCDACGVGKYQNERGKTSCKNCPTGYTSAEGSTAETKCFITVPAGKKLVAKSTPTNCDTGTFRSDEVTKYYGESLNCTDCPTGYTSAAGAIAQNKCYLKVPSGKKLVAKSTPTNCTAGTFRNGEVTKYYGESISCTNCVVGSYSAAGASSCTACEKGKKSTAGSSSCTVSCGISNVSTWKTPSWNTNNTMTNLCIPDSCSTGYHLVSISCDVNTYTVKYNGNGATRGSTASSSHTYGVSKNLTANGFGRDGYKYDGWATSETGAKVYNDKQLVVNLSTTHNATVNIYAHWNQITYTVKYDCNGGTGSTSSSSHTYDVDKALTANGCSYAGKSFSGWATSSSGSVVYSNQQTVKNLTKEDGGTVTLYAKWGGCSNSAGVASYSSGCNVSSCVAGYYKNGNACTKCPDGYTSNAGSTAQNQCYMNVVGGKYLVAKASSATNCVAGTARSGTVTKYYGESVSCSQCTAGTYQNEAGKTSCKSCPDGYTSSQGATAENQCFVTVNGGQKLVAKAKPSSCDAGTYRSGSVTKNYGESVSCSACGTGTYSGSGASSCTSCVAGSYQDQTGQSSCKACSGGKTGGTGRTSACTDNCSNGTGVSGWKSPSWNTNNTMSNLCTANTCNSCYAISGSNCSSQSTLYVSGSGSDSNSGVTTNSPFASIQKAYNCPASNITIKLLSNITVTNPTNFDKSKTVTLTSNSGSYIIYRGSGLKSGDYYSCNMLNLKSGSLTTKNIILDGNNIATSQCRVIVATGRSTLNLNSGTTIRNNINNHEWTGSGVIITGRSTVYINGATITNNVCNDSTGGICVEDSSTGTMNSGTISNNRGIGIGIWDATFTLNGGNIYGNTINGVIAGGNANVSGTNSKFIMTGGNIYNNNCNDSKGKVGGGIHLRNGNGKNTTSFTMTGGNIYNNSCSSGGGIFISHGGINTSITGGSIYNNSPNNTYYEP